MKKVVLIVGFSVIALLAGMNVNVLWDGGGIGTLIAMLYSFVGTALAILIAFISIKDKWLLIPKLIALFVMMLTASNPLFEYTILEPINALLIPANASVALSCFLASYMILRAKE